MIIISNGLTLIEGDPELDPSRQKFTRELMRPMFAEFTRAVAEVRAAGGGEAEIEDIIRRVEDAHRGYVDEADLDFLVSELRLAAQRGALRAKNLAGLALPTER